MAAMLLLNLHASG